MRYILPVVFVGLLAGFVVAQSTDSPSSASVSAIPVTVGLAVESVDLKAGDPIPIGVTIHNDLPAEIRYSTYRLEPIDWNGETVNVTLVDVYREGESRGLYLAKPKVDAPHRISGMGSHRIESGKELTIRTDAGKWEIVGGWKPGNYRVTVRVERLYVDDGRCHLSVHSTPVEFTIK